jgi:mRNA-degrading endonuclease YafQ of YafQ-DinJ toxin-antitoxin module
MVMKKISILEDNPSYPSLRTKPVLGTIDYNESSINMDIRVIWRFTDDRTITIMDVGHHDIIDGY